MTADLRLYFPAEQPKPQFPASKIFSVEQILWGTDPLGAPVIPLALCAWAALGYSQILGSQIFTYQVHFSYYELQADPKMKGAIIGMFVVTLAFACLFLIVSSKLIIVHLYNKAIPARSLHKNLYVARWYKNDFTWDKGNQKLLYLHLQLWLFQ